MQDSSNKKMYFKIYGGRALKGEINVSGAKNSVLPLLFASLLAKGEHKFKNVPDLKDVHLTLKILSSLGMTYERFADRLMVQNSGGTGTDPCPDSAKSFRASVLCLAPLLACFGKVKIPLPGGCEIGSRPIDIHLKGLKQLGAKIFIEEGWIYGSVPKEGLKASQIKLDFPSVGATENLIMASVLAKGTSSLQNVACEPEITDLINYLKMLGAQIEQVSPRELKITGVSKLKAFDEVYKVIPDRIEAGTWLITGACTKGEIVVRKCQPEHLTDLLDKLSEAGFTVKSKESEIFIKSGKQHKSLDITTGVYPAFPTDLQSQFMALMTQLEGTSSLKETVFENRFRYIQQLNLLGAGIQIKDQQAFVKGPVLLQGNKMEATDLRAGAGLVLAGLTAKGESKVYGLHHIERGYENFFLKLKSIDADIQLLEDQG